MKKPAYSFTANIALLKEPKAVKIRTPEECYNFLLDMATMSQEAFAVITMNTKNFVIDRHLVSLGLVNCSLAHPREVFRPAITDGAAAIILAHNHPSGDPAPSAEDIRITRQMVEASKIMDIPILDHIIIGTGERPWISLRESGIVSFTDPK